jgi:hypothetical protein
MQTYTPRPYTPRELGVKFTPRHASKPKTSTLDLIAYLIAGALGAATLKLLATLIIR